AVLAGTRLGFVGIDHEIGRPPASVLRHERPFETGRETGTAAPAQLGLLDVLDDRVAAAFEDRLGVVPDAATARAGKAPVVVGVEIAEYPVLIAQHGQAPRFWSSSVCRSFGSDPRRPFCGPAG